MKVLLTHEESEEIFYTALCNSLAWIENGYELNLTFFNAHHDEARKVLRQGEKESPEFPAYAICYEDILMQILRNGHTLTMVDVGCEGEYTSTITLQDVHERVQEAPINHLMDAINETGDAVTGDVILQQVFFKEVIFG